MIRNWTACLAVLVGLSAAGGPLPLCAADQAAGVGLSQAEFRWLHDALAPEQAAWEEIPWRLSLLEACAAAATEKKPVYMLVRSGHPLGCV